ncbi:recombinase family protein [Rubrobacter xylanophilus]|nr:recombinase family protein [Rubrobacter xylanophilus]
MEVRAAAYIRTESSSGLPSLEEQRAAVRRYAEGRGYELVETYEDVEAPGHLLYHKPALKEAIRNIKELEEWEVLVVADPRCISETQSALHEFVHKLSLYGNRLESPVKSWEELLEEMREYRRSMARKKS